MHSPSLLQKNTDISSAMEGIFSLEKASGVAQHHDAITGTEKQPVADDYHRRLADGISAALDSTLAVNGFQHCPLMNVSICHVTEQAEVFTFAVYNPLGRTRDAWVRIPVTGLDWRVADLQTGLDMAVQAVPIPQRVLDVPANRSTDATHDLVVKIESMPPLSLQLFEATALTSPAGHDLTAPQEDRSIRVKKNGQMVNIAFEGQDGNTLNLNQELMWYTGNRGNNSEFEYRASGAYIFRPLETEPNSMEEIEPSRITSVTGELITEHHIEFGAYASEIVRTYEGQEGVEIEWLVGSKIN